MTASAPPSQPPAVVKSEPCPPVAAISDVGGLRRAGRWCGACGGSGFQSAWPSNESGEQARRVSCEACGGRGRFKLGVAPPVSLPRKALGNRVSVWARLARPTQLALLGLRGIVRRDEIGRPTVGHLSARDVARLNAWCRRNP